METSPGNSNPNPPQATLAISNFNPKSASVGTTVMITGTAFGTDSSVVSIKFGLSAGVRPKTIKTTELTAIVPSDATTGKLQVTVKGVSVSSSDTFKLIKDSTPIVIVDNFSPDSAYIGDTINITGSGFGTDTNFVSINLLVHHQSSP